jgi:hypothetical protein
MAAKSDGWLKAAFEFGEVPGHMLVTDGTVGVS